MVLPARVYSKSQAIGKKRKSNYWRRVQLEPLEVRAMLTASVATDQDDYLPGETAFISGSGFQSGETVRLQVLHTDGTPNTGEGHEAWYVVDGGDGDLDGLADGRFETTWFVSPDDSAGSAFELTAKGLSSLELALTKFTDGMNLEAWENLKSSWTNSSLDSNNARYNEGAVIPFRFSDTGESAGSQHTVILKYDFSNGDDRFFDSLGSYNASVTGVNPTVGISGLGSIATWTIPSDLTLPAGAQSPGVLTTYNIASLSFGGYTLASGVKQLSLTYTVTAGGGKKNVAILYGEHLANSSVWGAANGAGSFPITIGKGYATIDGRSPEDVQIKASAVNGSPVANNQSVVTAEEVAKSITLTGSDPDGNPLTYSVVTPPLHGTLSGTAPNLTYTPSSNYSGPDSFTFRTSDGTLNSNPGTVSITVTPVNDAPAANGQSVVTPEDTARPITLTGSDPDNDPLTYSIVTPPARGTLTGTAPNLTYTPGPNYQGADSFTFRTSDGALSSSLATVSITVTPVNDAPTANNQSVTTPEDTAKSITLTGGDLEGGPLTFSIVTPPTLGTLSDTAPNLTYTPNANYQGSDSFTFKTNDGAFDSSPATVSIAVTPVNDAPTANNQSVTTPEDTAKTITLAGSDPDGDPLTFFIVTPPTLGTLSGTAPNLTYTPSSNYRGSDSFTFRTSDGTLTSNLATVAITVTPVNDAPTAINQSVTTPEDTAKSITLTGGDPDGNPLTFSIVTTPTRGTLSGTAPNLTYTPSSNYQGSDSFTFKTNDGALDSNVATVSIAVTPVNDAPAANSQSITTSKDTAKSLTLTGNDVDGDPLTFSIVTPPAHGTLSGTAPNLTYTPSLNYVGADSFTFKTNDGTLNSATAMVSITVTTSANSAPTANNQSVTTPEDTAKSITLTGGDPDGNPLTFSIVTLPTRGTLSGTAPNLTYTPNSNYQGADSFTFRTSDGVLNSNPATVSITVTPVNDAPTANSQSISTQKDTAKSVALTGGDPDGDPLAYSVVTPPAHGTLSGTAPNLTYTPSLNYVGADSFTFKTSDGALNSATATVSITVTSVNSAPTANNQSVTTPEDTAKLITLTGSDPDGNPLTFSIVTSPSNGTLNGTAPNLTYTPSLHYQGADSFTFRASDGALNSNLATVSINVTPVNDAPTANSQAIVTSEDTAKPITLTGSDPDGNPLAFSIVTPPTRGTLSGTAPNLTYTPNSNYQGADSVTFRTSDGALNSNLATVSITVTPVNDAPTANSQSITTPGDTAKPITLTGGDPDGDALAFSIVTPPAHGTLSGTAPNLSYTPSLNYQGADSFTFRANDGALNSALATVSITVGSSNVFFAVIGDFGTDTTSERDVANQVKSWNPQFITTLGDNNYPDGEASTIDANIGKYYQEYIYPYFGTYGPGSPASLGNRFFPTLGNHDWHVPGAQPYLDYFTLPGNERYYTFTKGPVQFFMLDSDASEPDGRTPTSVQGVWLQNAMAASTATWKLVMFHHTPYSSGTHGSNPTMTKWPFKEWGASAVLAGHNTLYERVLVDGLTFFTNGMGGDDLTDEEDLAPAVPGTQFRYIDDYGAMRVNADDTHITFEFVNTSGTVIDTHTLNASSPPPSVSIVATDAAAAEPGTNTGALTITRTGNTTDSLLVNYVISGTAANGTDYNQISGTVTIAAGEASASLPITPLNDTLIEGNESLVVTIANSPLYNLGLTTSAIVTIGDDETFGPSTLNARVSASVDDAEESDLGSVNLVSADLELVYDGNHQTVGVRFANLGIPNGAVITNAYVQFVTDYASTGAANLTIRGQATDSAAAFEKVLSNVSSRLRTTAAVAWSPADWPTAGEAGLAQRTPNLAPIIQEIVNRAGWASGNAIALTVNGSGVRRASAYDRLPANAPLLHVEYAMNQPPIVNAGPDQALAFTSPTTTVSLVGQASDDGFPAPPNLALQWTKVSGPGTVTFANAASASTSATFSAAGSYVLRLTASDGLTSSSDDVAIVLQQATAQVFEARTITGDDDAEETYGASKNVYTIDAAIDLGAYIIGLRYQGVDIPQGATITKAYLQFSADKSNTLATSVNIRAQAIDDAPTFSMTAGNISSRTKTVASADWAIPDWTAGDTGADQRTPDLADVIQEVVNRTGWNAQNALALIITGSGARAAASYQRSPTRSPILHIEYTAAPQAMMASLMPWETSSMIPASSTFDDAPSVTTNSRPLTATELAFSQEKVAAAALLPRTTTARRATALVGPSVRLGKAHDEVFRLLGGPSSNGR